MVSRALGPALEVDDVHERVVGRPQVRRGVGSARTDPRPPRMHRDSAAEMALRDVDARPERV